MSKISPQDTLVTDFFGGVASVEVQPSSAKLPLRQAPAPWRVIRTKTIGKREGPRTFKSSSPKSVKGEGEWSKPLERGTGIVSQVVGGLAITGITGLLLLKIVT